TRRGVGSWGCFLSLQILVEEFASQQFRRIVGNVPQPLFQRLLLFQAGALRSAIGSACAVAIVRVGLRLRVGAVIAARQTLVDAAGWVGASRAASVTGVLFLFRSGRCGRASGVLGGCTVSRA